MQSPMFGNVKTPIKRKYSVESHIILKLWVFEEIRSYSKTQIIHIVWLIQNFILWEYYREN